VTLANHIVTHGSAIHQTPRLLNLSAPFAFCFQNSNHTHTILHFSISSSPRRTPPCSAVNLHLPSSEPHLQHSALQLSVLHLPHQLSAPQVSVPLLQLLLLVLLLHPLSVVVLPSSQHRSLLNHNPNNSSSNSIIHSFNYHLLLVLGFRILRRHRNLRRFQILN